MARRPPTSVRATRAEGLRRCTRRVDARRPGRRRHGDRQLEAPSKSSRWSDVQGTAPSPTHRAGTIPVLPGTASPRWEDGARPWSRRASRPLGGHARGDPEGHPPADGADVVESAAPGERMPQDSDPGQTRMRAGQLRARSPERLVLPHPSCWVITRRPEAPWLTTPSATATAPTCSPRRRAATLGQRRRRPRGRPRSLDHRAATDWAGMMNARSSSWCLMARDRVHNAFRATTASAGHGALLPRRAPCSCSPSSPSEFAPSALARGPCEATSSPAPAPWGREDDLKHVASRRHLRRRGGVVRPTRRWSSPMSGSSAPGPRASRTLRAALELVEGRRLASSPTPMLAHADFVGDDFAT